MAKANLLNTSTSNYLELIGNGRRYEVPPYQRDYSWGPDKWEDLWNDLELVRENPDEIHYMGALVIQAKTDRVFEIIDGQQRLVTLSLLSLAVISLLENLAKNGIESDSNNERAKALRNRFIGEKDPASLLESSKLKLNQTNDAFYQDNLVQLRPPISQSSLPKSDALLWKCFKFFHTQLENLVSKGMNGEGLANFLNETAGRNLNFIRIIVEDELNAYTVFETLNARGLELTSTDLLKNYLFSLVKAPGDRESLQRRWQKLLDRVSSERFPEFLRYHLLCRFAKVRRERLFKMVREEVRTPEQVDQLLLDLEPRAELFAALRDPNHEWWANQSGARKHVRDLNLFKVRQMTPLLFAGFEAFELDQFVSLVRIVSIISFRYTVIGDLNTNELEPIYHSAAKAVLDKSAKSPKEAFEYLRSIYVPDENFVSAFANVSLEGEGKPKKIAKYILARFESDLSNSEHDPDTDPATVEHILPENPVSAWQEAIKIDDWSKYAYRLGNLALIEAGINRDVSNSIYPEKVKAYGKSNYFNVLKLIREAPETWTVDHIRARQEAMAKRAAHLWRLDY